MMLCSINLTFLTIYLMDDIYLYSHNLNATFVTLAMIHVAVFFNAK